LGAFQVNGWYALAAGTTLVLGAAYTLWMVKRIIFGFSEKEEVVVLKDIQSRETAFLSLLVASVFLIGLWPAPLLDVMHVSVENLLHHVTVSKL
jgi:NADH-quinone oxidoreductase subunit M